MKRHDYAFPFRIDPASRQAGQTDYGRHVAQMIRQILLTAPGERADLPEFGCGLRGLVFAPHSDALDATVKMTVQQSLNRWLAGQIEVGKINVAPLSETGDAAQLLIRVEYALVETRSAGQVEVIVS